MTDHDPQDDPLTSLIRDEFRRPPPTPRDEIWAGIRAKRIAQAAPRPHATFHHRPLVVAGWITGIAAALVLGIGLGRIMAPTTAVSPVAGSSSPESTVALSAATVQHLSAVETLLTSFRTGQEGESFAALARDLLTTTRLLLDTKAMTDRKTQALLEDLEFVLAQIIQAPTDRPVDRDLIADGLNQRELLPRLRTAIPAGGTSLRLLGEL